MRDWARLVLVSVVLVYSTAEMSYAYDSSHEELGHQRTAEEKHIGSGDIQTGAETLGLSLFTAWIPSDQRSRLRNADIALRDHDGKPRVLDELLNQPTLITFFYSRCQNASRCSMVMSQLAFLQEELVRAGIHEEVRLIAITYEPQFDTPERINRYATDRGLRLGEQALSIQLDGKRQQEFLDELQAPVNYNSVWVNTHGVQLNLLDKQGRLVRKYETLLWRNDKVIEDLKRLIAER